MRPLLLAAAAVAALAAAPVAADTLARLRDTGEIRLGVRTDAPPLSFDKEGAPAGYTVDVCRAVVAKLGEGLGRDLRPVYVTVTAEDRFAAVTEGRVDLLCGADTVTLARRETVDFSIPVFIDGASVMMKRDALTDMQGLAGKTVGVRDGTTTEEALLVTIGRMGLDAEVLAVADHEEGVAKLLAGEIAAYFADQSILLFLVAGSPDRERLALSGNVLTVEPHALALPLGDGAFRLAVDRALSDLFREGEIAKLFEANFAPATMGDAMRALMVLAPIPR
jgi:polar amino acid transport system substrate-binding protein/glutamate/aspartate transport system substrate-binding protein